MRERMRLYQARAVFFAVCAILVPVVAQFALSMVPIFGPYRGELP
ncbi:MAG: EamA domain-containing membrane protein RarD [Polyangiales bacterium]|jgi:EamA domain-containing membrane protein RarD